MKSLLNSFAFRMWILFSIAGLLLSIPLSYYYSNINYKLLEEHAKTELEAMAKASSLSIELAIKSNDFQIIEETINQISIDNRYAFIAILEQDDDAEESKLFKCFPDSLTKNRPFFDSVTYYLNESALETEIIKGNIIIGISKTADAKKLQDLNKPILHLTILANLILLVLSSLFFLLITNPLRLASQFAAELSKENYTSELRSTKGKNEISVLNNSLNTLKKNLMQHKETNDSLVNNLKKLVSKEKARTIELNDTATLIQAQQLARMGSWEVDIASNHMFFSKGVFDVLQVDHKKFIPSHDNYINLLHPDDRQKTDDSFNNAIKDKKDYVLIQRRILDNGESIYLECRGQIDLGKDGEVKRLHGILIDISDKVLAQQVKEDFTKELEIKVKVRTNELVERTTELRENELKLEKSLSKEKAKTIALIDSENKLKVSLLKEKELGDLKTSFVSMASHQFRTPLSVIQANTELFNILASAGKKIEPEKCEKITGRIKNEIIKMTELMDEVLILGKLTSGNVHFAPKEIDIINFCNQLVEEFNLIQDDGRTLDFKFEGEPYIVNLDPKLLTHTFSNLISNAFKYSVGNKNPLLTIYFKPKELLVSVKDYGLGIPKAELSNLFQPFFRANNVIGIKGTGLGLNIAKEYAEINKGQISVKSTLGEGSCFEIKFKH